MGIVFKTLLSVLNQNHWVRLIVMYCKSALVLLMKCMREVALSDSWMNYSFQWLSWSSSQKRLIHESNIASFSFINSWTSHGELGWMSVNKGTLEDLNSACVTWNFIYAFIFGWTVPFNTHKHYLSKVWGR